ncbi:MAG: TauD/TfdA family dioxygenase [Gemmatimonadota bacterium]|nr:TauD/TfdA family dioxygenase [Gemmatimonadota bacterium]
MINIIPTGASLGAEVRGLDLSRPLEPEVRDEVVAEWHRHQVLLFRDQDLDDEALIAFTGTIGEIQEAPDSDVTGGFGSYSDVPPAITIISNIEKNGKQIGSLGNAEASWHTDMSFIDTPPAGSVLYALQVPASGGNTGFCNMYAGYETLDTDIKARINGRHAIHDFTYTSAGLVRVGHEEVTDVRDTPGARHPLVRIHPETGRKCLFLGRRINGYILDLPVPESEALLDLLWAESTRPEFTWEHAWRKGDVVMWDNRCVMHSRSAFDPTDIRLMHRTQIKGDLPY